VLRLMARRAGRGAVLTVLLAFACLPGAVRGQEPASADSAATASADSAAAEEGSWVERTMRRYFGGRGQQGDELAGTADQLVDRYVEHIGKPIEVVLVYAVNRFEEGWDADKDAGTRILNDITQPLQSYTRDDLVRQYLLFEQGDKIDPFLLADSERMLRDLEFINDVRIVLVPLAGEIESVAVVVEYRDRWPFGITGTIKDVNWYEAGLYHTNIAGRGIRFDAKLLYRKGFDNEMGYRLGLRKGNFRGTFFDLALEYEDSWRELRRFAEVRRDLVHFGIRWVGGFGYEDTDVRDDGGIPQHFSEGDVWGGRTIRLDQRPADVTATRKVLVPAVRFFNRGWRNRPEVRADTNQTYHDVRSYQVGLTYQRIKNYKTSYLFRMGELENIPSGNVHKATTGYEDGEFNNRTFFFLQNSFGSVRNRGDIVFARVDFGGYLRNGRFEDGALRLLGSYITPLLGQGRYRTRFYTRAEYVLGIERVDPRGLMLGNRTGLREMPEYRVYGDQRLVLQAESRTFTPWRVWGFHFMVFGFVDFGGVTGEDQDLLGAKYYTSAGLGLRLNNPDLVLPTLQLRVAFLNKIEGGGVLFAFKAGNPEYPPLRVPDVRPGGFPYE